MSVGNESVPANTGASMDAISDVAESAARSWWGRLDASLERIGDYLNPILVKETRQALKSRQFTATFWLLLVCGVGWSFLGIAIRMPSVYYVPSGPEMLIGYFIVLCVPLLLVVPFSAYRSLAMEKEDGTYELLSITSLSARQIVTGKLGSALMQMVVYYAALAPCIAFTYLLRGMDLGTIIVILVGTFLVSVLFSTVGLVFAGMQQSRQWQALSSVLLLLVLLGAGFFWTVGMTSFVMNGQSAMNTAKFWQGAGMFVTMHASFLALLILVAAAQNGFATDNRATKIRIAMLIQLVLFGGWLLFMWFSDEQKEFGVVMLIPAAIFWMLYSAIMTGEVAELSPRARRDLPQSFMGRTFLTWFNPGSATGYIFCMSSFGAYVLVALGVNLYASANALSMAFAQNQYNAFAILLWSYMAFYLGLGRLLVLWLRKFSNFGFAVVIMIHCLILVVSAAVPTFLQFWWERFRDIDYSTFQVLNWWWTLLEAFSTTWMMGFPMIVVGGLGLAMFLLNLVLAAREVEATRLATPERVQQDEYRAKGMATEFVGASMAENVSESGGEHATPPATQSDPFAGGSDADLGPLVD